MSTKKGSVGYACPPEHSQWKPGQSGNPSGRPKKSVKLVEGLINEANATIPISENGITQDVPKLHVAVKALFNKSMKGDVKALALLLKIWNPAEIEAHQWFEEQNKKAVEKAVAEARQIIAKRRARRAKAEAASEGDSTVAPPLVDENEDMQLQAFLAAQADATKEGKILNYDAWLEDHGVPNKYIGDT